MAMNNDGVANIITKLPVASIKKVVVRDVGDKVELVVGNSSLLFEYEDAFEIGLALRQFAKIAKRKAGDQSRRFRVSGVLTDASKR